MTQPEKRSETLLSALRDDLPSSEDEARIRRRLTAAGVAVGTAVATSNLAHAAVASATKVAMTSTAPPLGVLGSASSAAGFAKGGALVAATWASLTTGAKLAVVGVAIVGGAYPAVTHWADASSQKQAKALAIAPVQIAALPASSAVVGRSAPAATPSAQLTVPQLTEPTAVEQGGARNRAQDGARNAGSQRLTLASPSGNSRAVGPAATSVASVTSSVDPMPASQRLRDETALIERALVAVRANDKSAAERSLQEHEQRFPSGVLVRERERLRATLR